MRQAAEVSAMSGAADLAVVDEDNNFVGTLSEGDLMRAALPSLSDAMAGGEQPRSGFELIEEKAQEIAGNPIDPSSSATRSRSSPNDPGAQGCGPDGGQADPPVYRWSRAASWCGTVARADICRAVFR